MLNIAEIAIKDDSFTLLADGLLSTNLIITFKQSGPFTLFAPNDEAFAQIDPIILTGLIADNHSLQKVSLSHAVKGKYMLADLIDLDVLSSMEGCDIYINANRFDVRVNNSVVTLGDIECSNGVIHVIDSIHFPSIFDF